MTEIDDGRQRRAQTRRDMRGAGQSSVGGLIAAVGDDNPTVRRLAVGLLEELGDNRAVPALIGALEDPVREVREEAAAALGKFRGDRAASALIDALAHPSPNVRRVVIGLLKDLGD